MRPAPENPRQRFVPIGEQPPEWASHRLRIRPMDGSYWMDSHWFYLGPHDIFAMPESADADRLRRIGFEVWWEGRKGPDQPWQFVEIQRFEAQPERRVFSN